MIFDVGLLAPAASGAGLLIALIIYILVAKKTAGKGRMSAIADEIYLGTMTFIKAQYAKFIIFVIVVAAFLFWAQGVNLALGFIAGAFTSSLAGLFGLMAATTGNVRTAVAAKDKGLSSALQISFYSGAVMGLSVASFGLIALGGIYYYFDHSTQILPALIVFFLGTSSASFFSRICGGIFAKAADIGTDLVGKFEAGIPEDDPRNPGVIADSVGDNVGDLAGMGADIYESYIGSIVAIFIITTTMTIANVKNLFPNMSQDMLFSLPLLLFIIGLAASFIGIVLINIFKSMRPTFAVNFSEISARILFLCGSGYYMYQANYNLNIFWAILSGAISGFAVDRITEFYRYGKPVKKVAESTKFGTAINIISGLAVGLGSSWLPILIIMTSAFASFNFAGYYGVAISAVGMLATVGITVTISAFGSIVDNACGISKMAQLGSSDRKACESLGAYNRSGKGFAIAASVITSLSLFIAYYQIVHVRNLGKTSGTDDPIVIVGLFLGAAIIFAIASLILKSVSKAAGQMVTEIRRQFREIPGLLSSTGKPDTARCVEIAANVALREMIVPILLAVMTPVLIGTVLGVGALGGTLLGALITGVSLAFFTTNAGGVWDGAKKYIKSGQLDGDKGSGPAYQAAIVGDTVGDSFKGAVGPAMNVLLKLMVIVALAMIKW